MSDTKYPTPSELLSPAAQASVNAMISSAVREMFAQMAPVFEKVALTPEKLREATKPYVDPAVVAREQRERQLMREDLAQAEKDKTARQNSCSHQDNNNQWCVSLIHNYPDRQTRGVCMHCHLLLEPKHWEIGAPDPQNPRGKPVLVSEHPLYHIVRQIEATQPA